MQEAKPCQLQKVCNLHRNTVTFSVALDFLTYADTLDCLISFFSSPPPHWSHILVTIGISLYDTILMVTWVQYDLSGLVLYNINLGATTMTSLSTRGVTIPINLVISTTGLLTVNSSSVKSLMALGYSAWVQLWCCEDKESVIRGTGVQRRAQSSSWTDDERKLDLSRERWIQDWGKVQLLRDTYTWYRTAYSK